MCSMDGCETVYISNLNDRVKAEDLKALLYEVCAAYGEVVSVHVVRGKKSAQGKPIRGTAFVSFRTVPQAAAAMRNLKDFPLLGKPMQTQFALNRADEISRLHGTYKPRQKSSLRKKITP